jgi:acetylornithine deacetylase/succinyl-diaminopimelate desuccinylase-like protein
MNYMTAEEAVEIAKAFGDSQGRPFDDHTFEAVFVPKNDRLNPPDEGDDYWDVWVTYNPVKGLMTPDSCVVKVNCRTRQATLIKLA